METKNYKGKRYFKVSCFRNLFNTQILTLGKPKFPFPEFQSRGRLKPMLMWRLDPNGNQKL